MTSDSMAIMNTEMNTTTTAKSSFATDGIASFFPYSSPFDWTGEYDADEYRDLPIFNSEKDMIVNVTAEYPLDAAIIVLGYIMPFVVILTFITNTLVVIVLAQKHMRTPTNIVLFTMAIVDLLTLLFPAPWYFSIYTLGNHDKPLFPPKACYAHYVMTDVIPVFFHTSSIWLALLLASQRYIYVCHPQLARTWCTVPRVKKAIVIIIVTAFLSQSTKFFECKFSPGLTPDGTQLAVAITTADWVVQNLNADLYFMTYQMFKILFVFVIPSLALIMLNYLLFRALRRAECKRTELLKSRFKMIRSSRTIDELGPRGSSLNSTMAPNCHTIAGVSAITNIGAASGSSGQRKSSTVALSTGDQQQQQQQGRQVSNQVWPLSTRGGSGNGSFIKQQSTDEKQLIGAASSLANGHTGAAANHGNQSGVNADIDGDRDGSKDDVLRRTSGDNNNNNNVSGDEDDPDDDDDESICPECAAYSGHRGHVDCRRCSAATDDGVGAICDRGDLHLYHHGLSQCSSLLGATNTTTNEEDEDGDDGDDMSSCAAAVITHHASSVSGHDDGGGEGDAARASSSAAAVQSGADSEQVDQAAADSGSARGECLDEDDVDPERAGGEHNQGDTTKTGDNNNIGHRPARLAKSGSVECRLACGCLAPGRGSSASSYRAASARDFRPPRLHATGRRPMSSSSSTSCRHPCSQCAAIGCGCRPVPHHSNQQHLLRHQMSLTDERNGNGDGETARRRQRPTANCCPVDPCAAEAAAAAAGPEEPGNEQLQATAGKTGSDNNKCLRAACSSSDPCINNRRTGTGAGAGGGADRAQSRGSGHLDGSSDGIELSVIRVRGLPRHGRQCSKHQRSFCAGERIAEVTVSDNAGIGKAGGRAGRSSDGAAHLFGSEDRALPTTATTTTTNVNGSSGSSHGPDVGLMQATHAINCAPADSSNGSSSNLLAGGSRRKGTLPTAMGSSSGRQQQPPAKSPSFTGSVIGGASSVTGAPHLANSHSHNHSHNHNPPSHPHQSRASLGPTLATTTTTVRTIDSNRTTLMLIVVVTVFLMVEVPQAIVTAIGFTINAFGVVTPPNFRSQFDYTKLWTNFLIMISYSINFTIYCSMSKKFRDTFRDLFLCKRYRSGPRGSAMDAMMRQNQSTMYCPPSQLFSPPNLNISMASETNAYGVGGAGSSARRATVTHTGNEAASGAALDGSSSRGSALGYSQSRGRASTSALTSETTLNNSTAPLKLPERKRSEL